LTPFFTSVRLCAYEPQKYLGTIGFILKLRNVKICSAFFSQIILKKYEKSTLKIGHLIDIIGAV